MKLFGSVFKKTVTHFMAQGGPRMGAALSYYAVFSIAPLGILIIAIVGSIFGTQLVESNVALQLERFMGEGAGELVSTIITGITSQSLSVVGTILSIATILFGVISLFSVLDSSLDELWETKVPRSEKRRPLIERMQRMVQRKIPVFSLIPLVALLFLFVISASVFTTLFSQELAVLLPFAFIIEPVFLFILGTLFFAFIYRILPERRLPTKELLLGGAITSALFLIGRLIIGYYIARFAHTSLYGAAGSLVALLIWIYYSAQVFFFGASFTYIYSKTKGVLSK